MTATKHLTRIAALIALSFSWPAVAEDIDIFKKEPTITSARPNVLLVLNNSSSMNGSTTLFDGSKGNKLEMIRQVLNTIIDPDNNLKNYGPCTISGTTRTPTGCITPGEVKVLLNGINLGLMLAVPSAGGAKGTYVRSHIHPMDTAANRIALLDKINFKPAIPPEIPSSGGDFYGLAMYEAYQYFGGKPAYAGFSPSAPFDTAAQNGINYVSPATLANQCADNYIIFVAEGTPASGEDKDATALLKDKVGGSTSVINFSPSNYISSTLDEYARALHKLDVVPGLTGTQTVTTYTVSVQTPEDNQFNNSGPTSARELLKSAAANGGGEFFLASNAQAAMKAFINMLQKMQAVNTVFAAVTLPVSVNVRGTFLNQVYMGQFRPDKDAKPRWPGNLKLYQIALDANDQPMLADRFGEGVEDTVNGFLLPDKTSFWTTTSNYWTFDEMGNPASSNDAPDGAIVEKGGAAQRLRTIYATSLTARNLYTCNGACAANAKYSDTLFNTSNTPLANNATLAADATERTALINWVRGEDNMDNEDGNGVATDVRARIHGDLLHSRPAVINYNRTTDDRDIVVYYGTNGGVFHAVKGGQHNDDGVEKWGIVFPEFLGKLKRLRDNSPAISAASRKPYFADGPVSVYQKDAKSDGKLSDADDKVYLYIGMRRGGRFMYAIDVSNPDEPRHLWKIDNSGSFTELGQTWSSPRPARINAVANDPVVIFGAGYDAENEDLSSAGTNDKGRGIFVVNGRTGALVKHIITDGMGSMPADVTVVDRDNNGIHDRIYAVDTKGNVWRTDINDANPANWQTFKIAALAGADAANARKFLNKPDVVFGKNYDAILVGSGDRENPFDKTVVNRFYMLRDTNVGFTGGLFCGTIEAPATCTESDLEDVTGNPHQDSPLTTGSKGWYMTMAMGEKVVGNAITVFGTTFFGTNRPTPPEPGMCTSNLGEAKLYSIGFETGNATRDLNADGVIDSNDRSEVIEGGGYLPSPVYAPVEIEKDKKKKKVDTVCIGPNCFGPGGKSYGTDRIRTYWRLQQ